MSSLATIVKKRALIELRRKICTGCGCEIDPEVCCCGDLAKHHNQLTGHAPVPYGCTCHLKCQAVEEAEDTREFGGR